MPTFIYTAIDPASGREKRGSIESSGLALAAAGLKARGLHPIQLAAAGSAPTAVSTTRRRRAWLPGRVIGAGGLAVFTRQLAVLLKAGLPILRALDVLARQESNSAFREVLLGMGGTIRAGGNFSDSLQCAPRVFDRFYASMVRAGEASGALDAVLERLALFLEKSERLKRRVRAAMLYPAAVLMIATGIVAALMVFVIPRFERIFAGLLNGAPLPALTRAVIAASGFAQHHGLALAVLAVAAIAGLRLLRRTRAGAQAWDAGLLKLPGLGALVLKAAVARFSRTLGTLLASGVPILPALQLTRDIADNVRVATVLDAVRDRVQEGEGMARPFAAAGIFPEMVTGMIEVGEETGRIDEMLGRIADTYDEEVDAALAGLTTLIEPAMIVLLAGVVGTIVVALFLPMIRVIQALS